MIGDRLTTGSSMRRTLPLFLLLAMPVVSHAHFLWATLEPADKSLAVALQEVPTQDPLPLGERVSKVQAWNLKKKSVSLTAEGNWLKASAAGDAAAVKLEYGVLDRSSEGRGVFRLRYFAKAATTAAASQAKLGLPLELSATQTPDKHWVVVVRQDGKPVGGASLTVEGGPEIKTSEDGTATLPVSDVLAVRALVEDKTKGSEDGKSYELTRSYSTLTIGGKGTKVKPLTQQLKESFGNQHEVVSHSGFIETVLAKKVTKDMLAVHLQQRELIHEAIDKILSGKPGVPYGEPQKEVLTLLRADMTSLGLKTAPARPITEAFLKQVAKESPYFALGVFHVYYGGITNGGRYIGSVIGEATGFTPTYYEKSDGYRAYLALVDQITDPAAQAEVIRGGKAAYQFIIDTNNESIFKTP